MIPVIIMAAFGVAGMLSPFLLAVSVANRRSLGKVRRMTVDNFVHIEELIAEWETDPVKSARLKEARARLAPLISTPGDGRYERLMRGEGPPRDAPQHCDGLSK